jgi:hypothetical protein
MSNDTGRFGQPTRACMQCGQGALDDALACTECGSNRIAITPTRNSIAANVKRSAMIASGVILLLQASNLAFLCIFEFSTFRGDSFVVRDVIEGYVAIGMYCLASAVGLCLLPRRAIPIGMKILTATLALPLLWEAFRLSFLCTLGVRLPAIHL